MYRAILSLFSCRWNFRLVFVVVLSWGSSEHASVYLLMAVGDSFSRWKQPLTGHEARVGGPGRKGHLQKPDEGSSLPPASAFSRAQLWLPSQGMETRWGASYSSGGWKCEVQVPARSVSFPGPDTFSPRPHVVDRERCALPQCLFLEGH